jgi:hypothetical protein
MNKVHILTRCDFFDGEAYFPVGEAESSTGKRYTRHVPCRDCQGSSLLEKWVSLKVFADMLDKAVSLESDYQVLAE